MNKENYELLRPFDAETVKVGDKLFCTYDKKEYEYVAGPDAGDWVVVKSTKGLFGMAVPKKLRLAPLFWCEGKPVYKGDVLYDTELLRDVVAERIDDHQYVTGSDGVDRPCKWLTWTKPKKNLMQVWVNLYKNGKCTAHYGKEEAERYGKAYENKFIETRLIEWEVEE